MDSDQKFVRQTVLISMIFAAVMTLGALALSLLLEKKEP